MTTLKTFRAVNGLTQKKLAEYLGIGDSFVSRIESGEVGLPKEHFIKILQNEQGWDVSMLQEDQPAGNINSVVNSKNFSYETGTVNSELIGIIKEQQSQMKESQRQMGILIDTIHKLSTK